MKKTVIWLAFVWGLGFLSAEGNVSFSGALETKWGVGAPWTDSSGGRMTIGDTSFEGKLDAYYDNSSAFADGKVSYDAGSEEICFLLGELWLDYSSSFWGIRLGRQKTAWGKADGIDITNVICPVDMSNLSAIMEDDNKLAIDAMRLSFYGNSFTIDAFWIPFFTPAKLPVSASGAKKPEVAIWNGEYALKMSGYLSAFDVSVYAYYGWDDIPLIDYAALTASYERMTMFGADAAVPVGETVLRFEAAYFPYRYSRTDELSALAGIDWMPDTWTLTAQYYCDYVFEKLTSLGRDEKYQHGVTLSLSKTFLNETLELSFSGVLEFNDLDSMISPEISYSLSDQISLTAGGIIFIPGPENDGQYGAYKDFSSLYIKAKYSF